MAATSPKRSQLFMFGGGGLAILALGGGALFYRRKINRR
jgi:LPXTG-motif cell wall-anchored protein